MKLLPVGAAEQSDWEDGLWVEKPGYPFIDASWIHPPPGGHAVPEFEFEEGDDKNKNEPAPVFCVGSGNDCHVRLDDDSLPDTVCRVYKEGRAWFLEAVLPEQGVHHGGDRLLVGCPVRLRDGDTFTLVRPPTPLAYRAVISEDDNWYIDMQSERDYPNKYPGRFPGRSSLHMAPPAPEELKRLAWQTDQMRRRSEEDQVRVADWSAFSQYVKRHYYKHGIECTPWALTGRGTPVSKKPPSFPPRALPTWIGELLSRERQLPGIDPGRELPFASSMRASGMAVPTPRDFQGGMPPHLELAGEGSATVAEPAAHDAGPRIPEAAGTNPHLQLPFRDWLESMDDSLFLMRYHDCIAANFDSLEQVHDIYCKKGELDKAFFNDTGIAKLGHKRIFEKWFRDFCR